MLRQGTDAAIIACGETVFHALEAADLLAHSGINVSVYDMFTIKPLDRDAVVHAAETGFVVTVEEHACFGGLGGAIAETLAELCPTRMKILGLPDERLYTGSSAEVFEHYGLNAIGIAKSVREGLDEV